MFYIIIIIICYCLSEGGSFKVFISYILLAIVLNNSLIPISPFADVSKKIILFVSANANKINLNFTFPSGILNFSFIHFYITFISG